MSIHERARMKIPSVAGSILLLMLGACSIASAENYIGIILDGYQKNCIVQSRGEDYDCKEKRQLYAGDKITKRPDTKALKIQWAPYASGRELDKTSLTVVFEPPKDKKGFAQGVREILGLVKTGHTVSLGATRVGSSDVIFQPGDNATLIPDHKSTFAWESDGGKYIIFKDKAKAEILKKDLKGESSIRLTPEEIGMSTGDIYLWSISGTKSAREYRIRLLPADVAQQVAADLGQIEKEAGGPVDTIIKKALYLQVMSDAYPQDIDLYWLSYQVLEGIKDQQGLNADEKAILDDLRRNYMRHVRETI
jgi:hypothetical protein